MKNIKLRKAIYTTMLASLLLTGCGKKAEIHNQLQKL